MNTNQTPGPLPTAPPEPTPDPNAIDLASQGWNSAAFGQASDQVYIYQTFIADGRPNITSIKVKIQVLF